MMFLFFLLIIAAATLVLISLFAPHKLPWFRPHLTLETKRSIPSTAQVVDRQPMILEGLADPEADLTPSIEEKFSRLEHLLEEKTRHIEKLQKQLAAEKSNREDFQKMKSILDEEIRSLRNQNKELRTQKGELHA